jgi:hypothetical protein
VCKFWCVLPQNSQKGKYHFISKTVFFQQCYLLDLSDTFIPTTLHQVLRWLDLTIIPTKVFILRAASYKQTILCYRIRDFTDFFTECCSFELKHTKLIYLSIRIGFY